MSYSFWLAARVLLYAPSHRQDSTYHILCYTSCGALAGMRNSSMKDRSNDPTYHEQMLLPRINISLPSKWQNHTCKAELNGCIRPWLTTSGITYRATDTHKCVDDRGCWNIHDCDGIYSDITQVFLKPEHILSFWWYWHGCCKICLISLLLLKIYCHALRANLSLMPSLN